MRSVTNKGEDPAFAFGLIDACRFRFATLAEAEAAAYFAARCFPEPERALPGLRALTTNAVEHGLWGLGGEEKRRLSAAGTLRDEVERRRRLPENTDRAASVTVSRKSGGVYAVVEDPGPGFAWKPYLRINPARGESPHGRGIAQARAASFDKLIYNAKGNKAVAFAAGDAPFNW